MSWTNRDLKAKKTAAAKAKKAGRATVARVMAASSGCHSFPKMSVVTTGWTYAEERKSAAEVEKMDVG